MKLLITAYDFRPSVGGIATVGYELAASFAKAGHDVEVLAPVRPGSEEADRHGLFRVTRRKISENSWIAFAQFIKGIQDAVRANRPDAIIHTVWFPEAGHAVLFPSIPHFAIVHGGEIMESDRTLRKRIRHRMAPLKRKIFHSLKGIFAVSRFTKNLIETECRVDGEKIQVVPNGVNADEFFPKAVSEEFRMRFGSNGKKVLITLARLENYKGNDRIIQALPRIAAAVPGIQLLIVGDGPDRPRLESLAQELNVEKFVRFTGRVGFEDRRDLYNMADVLLLMTRTDTGKPDCEGFGLVLLEAAACGKTAVASSEGGIPDAVMAGETGLLVNPHHPEEIANAVIRILTESKLKSDLESKAKARALALSWDRMAMTIASAISKETGRR